MTGEWVLEDDSLQPTYLRRLVVDYRYSVCISVDVSILSQKVYITKNLSEQPWSELDSNNIRGPFSERCQVCLVSTKKRANKS